MTDELHPEILVSISFRVPQAERMVDQFQLAKHLSKVMYESVVAGGDTVHISLQPYDPDEEVT